MVYTNTSPINGECGENEKRKHGYPVEKRGYVIECDKGPGYYRKLGDRCPF